MRIGTYIPTNYFFANFKLFDLISDKLNAVNMWISLADYDFFLISRFFIKMRTQRNLWQNVQKACVNHRTRGAEPFIFTIFTFAKVLTP
jgi:hypothetical protein